MFLLHSVRISIPKPGAVASHSSSHTAIGIFILVADNGRKLALGLVDLTIDKTAETVELFATFCLK